MTGQLAHEALELFNQRDYEAASPLLEQLVDAGDTPLPCILALAETREQLGNADGAARLLQNLYEALPQENFAVALVGVLLRAGDPAPLDALLPRLVAAHPDSARLLAMQSDHALKAGDWRTGLQLLPSRRALLRETMMTADLPCPAWDGAPFPGVLLVGTEQGLGDVILWSSLLRDLAARNQRALVACDARLLPLFRRSFPTLEFADATLQPLREPGQDLANRRIQCADLATLPWRADGTLPTRTPWLQADPARVTQLRARYRAQFPGRKIIGVSWASHRDLAGDSKSIPAADLAPLLADPGVACVSLQYGNIDADLAAWRARGLAMAVDPEIDMTRDLDDVAALACALDGVVSCSTSLAHLAGALGVDTCVLLPGQRFVRWYWGYEGDTPWYPTLHILRGPPRADWPALATLAARHFTAAP